MGSPLRACSRCGRARSRRRSRRTWAISDVVSNSIRVVKTKKQTSKIALTYMATVSTIVAEDGVQGLFLRGLGTKLITNGVSAMLFSILWKYFEQKLSAPAKDAKKKAN